MASEITYAEVRFKNESNSSGPYSDSATGKKYSGLNVGGEDEGRVMLVTGSPSALDWDLTGVAGVELFAE